MNLEIFRELVEDLFNCKHLDRLHELSCQKYDQQFEVSKDSSTEWHKKFYDRYHAGWREMSRAYIKLILDIDYNYHESFLYQSFPTFRVHLPGNLAVGAFHTDAEFGHPEGEENYIIPLTNSFGTASVWMESEPGKGDFSAKNMQVNSLIKFDGNHLRHGNKVNETGKTRVSLDFRILPMSKYKESEAQSMTTGTKFKIGHYYKVLE